MSSDSCLDGLSLALSQISFTVNELSKKNFKNNVSELKTIIKQFGQEAERHYFKCLLSSVDFVNERSSSKDSPQFQLLLQECQEIVTKSNFSSILCFAIECQGIPTFNILPILSRVLKLTIVQEVVFGLGLRQSSVEEIAASASSFVKDKFPELLSSYIESDLGNCQEGTGLSDVAIEVIHLLLTYLLGYAKQESIVDEEQQTAFLNSLRRDFPEERVPVVLAPLLYHIQSKREEEKLRLNFDIASIQQTTMPVELATVLKEKGYAATAKVEDCKDILTQCGVENITAECVAKVFGMMVTNLNTLESANSKTDDQSGTPKTWNVEVFVDAVKSVVSLNWGQVIAALDHSGFTINNADGLRLIMFAYYHATSDNFPVEDIYKPWKNSAGQLSWIDNALTNPEAFCFSDYPCHPVVTDILKSPPNETSREVATWKSLDLIGSLLQLSECGHYESVLTLFAYPVKHCPDILLLALLQVNSTWDTLRNDLVTNLMPVFLDNHPNSMSVLHYAWHGQGQSSTIRQLVMQSMADWYARAGAIGDAVEQQIRLSRILDVAQDLKALSMLLSSPPYPFVIDLAALASRREYLKLDKWLNDKIREHQEPFAAAVVNFLKKRCPQLTGIASDKEFPKAVQLPPETIATTLSCLQLHSNSFGTEISETIKTMLASHGPLLKARSGSFTSHPTLMMPIKRSSTDSALSAPPIGSQTDPFSSLGTTIPYSGSSSGSPLPGYGSSNPLGGTGSNPMSQGSSFMSLGSIGTSVASSKPHPLGPLLSSNTLPTSNPNGSSLQSPGINPPSLSHFGTGFGQSNGSSLLGNSDTSAIGKRPGGSSLGNSFSMFQQQQQAALSRSQTERMKQAASGDLSAVFPGIDQKFSKDVDDEANSYFQKIYSQAPSASPSVDDLLDMLKRFKDSPMKKERDVFHCMLRNLFEEYRFFPQYPDKELHITACLFGGIIEQGLVTYMALGVALRYVLEALRKPPNNSMYMFGVTALDRFKARLKDYPHYCQHLASIPHFHEFPPHLKDYIIYGKKNQEPPPSARQSQTDSPDMFGASSFGSIPFPGSSRLPGLSSPTPDSSSPLMTGLPQSKLSSGPQSPSAGASTTTATSVSSTGKSDAPQTTSTNIDTLLDASEPQVINQPPVPFQDKVNFIFNNISATNLAQKCEELKQHTASEHIPWLAQNFVMKRISIEPNFHQLYKDLLLTITMPSLSNAILQETHRNIKVLLQSDKGPSSFSDRSLLKNLGHWLGMQTLANNKPILYKDLELKSLVIEAFFKGQQELLYVVPFVAKVLESCSKSKVFKPPNPWLMGVMGVLVEMHHIPDLKLNLKFEIEVLCNTLSLELKSITPSNILKDDSILHRIDHQLTNEERPGGLSPEGVSSQLLAANPPTPLFSYHDISVTSLSGLAPHIQINQNIPLFQQFPHLFQCIRPAVERAVQELVLPVVDRAIKVSLTTVEMIVKKDFALDPEDHRMRTAAHQMVRNITAGSAMTTCRDAIQLGLNNHIKNNLLANLGGANAQQKEQIERVAASVANDNVELGCAFIQKTAVEKAVTEIDKRLATEYELRKQARSENRRYCDSQVLQYQAERMPEQVRLKVGGVTSNQMAVYEEFSRMIPGFLPPDGGSALPGSDSMYQSKAIESGGDHNSYITDDMVNILGKCAAEIEQHITLIKQQQNVNSQILHLSSPQNQACLTQLHNLLDMVVATRVGRDMASILKLITKAVEGLLETMLPSDTETALRYKDCHLIVLRGFQDPRGYGPLWTARNVHKVLAELPESDIKYNLDGVDILIRAHLININEYDVLLTQWLDSGRNVKAMQFASQLVRHYFVEERQRAILNESDIVNTLQTLSIVSQNRSTSEGLSSLLEKVQISTTQEFASGPQFQSELDKAPGGQLSMNQQTLSSVNKFEDPPELQEKVDYLLREWVRLYHHANAGRFSDNVFQLFVQQLHQCGILKSDDLITRFFRICTEMCVELTYRALADYSQNASMARPKCFPTIDAYCRLIALLVKNSGDPTNSITKINLLNRVLLIVANIAIQDHETRGSGFHQLVYHRIFMMLLMELNAPEPILEAINFQVLSCIATVLHDLRPSRVPGFAYSWLELVAHRNFMPKLLRHSPQQKGWMLYHQLLLDQFRFFAPFLKNVELSKQAHVLYRGTLRVLLVLLHDFPEFLCDYHFSFCDVIPPNCIQMRNLILSAFPRNMRLPDPFTPNLKVDLLSDIAHAPRILTDFAAAIQPANFLKDLDSYLKIRAPVTFLSELRSHLQVSREVGTNYNVSLMNALVLYVGTQAIAYIQSNSGGIPSIATITHSSHMDIFQNLAVDLDTEGRYLFLNAIANQLRFPNSHTHYFSCTLLYLFAEANSEAIQEQITRVLLERLIVNRPHPWGLLITFIELIKNQSYKFWSHDFVHCAPEVEKLFDSVARSCMQPKQPTSKSSSSETPEQ